MVETTEVLAAAKTILLVDWPGRIVPDSLARAGYTVFDHGGPEPDNYNAFEVDGDTVTIRRVGHLPEHADLVFTHRPTEELPEIAETARAIGATTLWRHSGLTPQGDSDPAACFVSAAESREGRAVAEAAGLAFIDDTYILDALRALTS